MKTMCSGIPSSRHLVIAPWAKGRSSFALISVLLVLAILTIMTVGFLTSMRTERLTARSYLTIFKAELAAQSGQLQAINKIQQALTAAGGAAFTTWGYYPDAANNSYYVGLTVGAPSLLNDTSWLSTANTRWLFSDSKQGDNPLSPANPDSISGSTTDLKSRIGSPSSLPVPWCEYQRITNGNVVEIYRFAYWIDDESSRIDLRSAGNTNGLGATYLRDLGTNTCEIPLLDLAAAKQAKVVQNRDKLFTQGTLPQIDNSDAILQNFSAQYKFLLTTSSQGYNVIQYAPTGTDPTLPCRGKAKMNLNYAGHTDSGTGVDTRVNRIADWMRYGAPDYFAKGSTNYFSAGYLGENNPAVRQEMFQTIAASIIDYLDTDNIPTQPPSLPDPTILTTPAAPVKFINAISRPAYFGAEACVRLNEVMTVWNRSSGAYSTTLGSAIARTGTAGNYTYTIPITRRFELWNMSNQNIPAAAYKVRWYYQQQISASTFGFGADPVPSNSEEIFDLGTLAFTPGEIKVVDVVNNYTTTGPTLKSTWQNIAYGPNGTLFGGDDEPANHDWAACVLFDDTTHAWLSATGYMVGLEGMNDGVTSSGPGNAGASKGNRINDPRMQPLRSYTPPTVSTTSNQTDRDWGGNTSNITYGTLNNTANFRYQNLDLWSDRPYQASALAGPLEPVTTVANGPMASVTELGNIFDPSWTHPRGRGTDTATADTYPYKTTLVTPFKGGGSLRIGQSDGQVNWGANSWILLDLFATSANTAGLTAETDWQGKLNVNIPKSVPGATNLTYALQLPSLTQTPPSGRGTDFDEKILYADIKARLTKGGAVTGWSKAQPFYSLGEMSELKSWTNINLYTPPETLINSPAAGTGPQIQMVNRSDRAREEIFRRCHDLLTTKGNSFRIYVVGQVGVTTVNNPNQITVLGTQGKEATVFFKQEFNSTTGALINIQPQILFQKDL